MTLPRGWKEVAIGDVLAPHHDGRTLHQGWSPRCERHPSERDDIWGVLKTTAIQAGRFLPEHNKQLPSKLEPRPAIEVQVGDMLTTSAGPRARCGVTCLVRESRPRLMLSGKMYRFRFNPELVDARFGEAYLLSASTVQAIDLMKTGISDSGLNITQAGFRKLPFLLPPLPEQKRIVEVIEEEFSRLEAAKESLRRGEANLSILRRSRLASLFREDWPAKVLTDVTDPERPICYGILKPKTTGDLQVPYVEVRSIVDGSLDTAALPRTTTALHHEFRRSELREGDVVMAIRGSFDRAAVVPADLEGGNVSRDVARIAPQSCLDPRYLALYLSSPVAFRFFSAAARGVAVKGVNIGDLRKMPIPVPDIEAQRLAVGEHERDVTVFRAMEAEVREGLRRSSSLRDSILAEAFAGRLTNGVMIA